MRGGRARRGPATASHAPPPARSYIDSRQYDMAYAVACLGVTEGDWRMLAGQSLAAMNLDVARKGYTRVRDLRFIELINQIDSVRRARAIGGGAGPRRCDGGINGGVGAQERKQGVDQRMFTAEVLAWQGRYAVLAHA